MVNESYILDLKVDDGSKSLDLKVDDGSKSD
jgi:hypothetical protein